MYTLIIVIIVVAVMAIGLGVGLGLGLRGKVPPPYQPPGGDPPGGGGDDGGDDTLTVAPIAAFVGTWVHSQPTSWGTTLTVTLVIDANGDASASVVDGTSPSLSIRSVSDFEATSDSVGILHSRGGSITAAQNVTRSGDTLTVGNGGPLTVGDYTRQD